MGTLMRLGRFTMLYNDKNDVSKPLWFPNPENEKELIKQECEMEPPHKQAKTRL